MHIILTLLLLGGVVRFAFRFQKYAYLTTLIPAILSCFFGILSKTMPLHGFETYPMLTFAILFFAAGSFLSGILCRISRKK